MMWLLLSASAHAGYGDAEGGFPSHVERQLLLWTNAARVDPEAFEDAYAMGGCGLSDFSDDERTPKAPLYLDIELTQVSREHSIDMEETPCFEHDSCDGTNWAERIMAVYDDTSFIGENIAYGVGDPMAAVLTLWMCSHSGHRGNIMSGDWNEMGPGVSGVYMTQDFAAGTLEDGEPPVRTGTHVGSDEGSMADAGFYADWGDASAPASLTVVVEGETRPLSRLYGTDKNGIYYTDADGLSESDCARYHFEWETASGATGRYPEDGSLLFGACDDDDRWVDEAGASGDGGSSSGEDDSDALKDIAITGCASLPSSPARWACVALVAVGLVWGTRRQR